MNTREIIGESLSYPFSDWKKIIFLGIIVLLSNTVNIINIFVNLNDQMHYFLIIMGRIIGLFAIGYVFRILQSSLKEDFEFPRFNNWVSMFIDGIKVSIVNLAYAVPAILLIITFIALHINYILNILASHSNSIEADMLLNSGIWGITAVIYMIIMFPVILMAVAHMAKNNGNLSSAFKIREITNKISVITKSKLTKWYIATIIILFLLVTVINIFVYPFSLTLERLLLYLFVTPYFGLYLYRSTGLIYNSGYRYLICDKCSGYYELQKNESPQDFSDECECGGKLYYHTSNEKLSN